MNNSFVQRQAEKLAERVTREGKGDSAGAIKAAYRYALGRLPQRDELKLAEAAIRDRGLFGVCWALLNSSEFLYVQ